MQANRALSAAREETRARLSAHRAALTAQVFADARAALAWLHGQPRLRAVACQSAADLAARLGAGAVLSVRTADLPLLKNALPAGCTLQADDTITLGGIRC